jgi:hypothetical protein
MIVNGNVVNQDALRLTSEFGFIMYGRFPQVEDISKTMEDIGGKSGAYTQDFTTTVSRIFGRYGELKRLASMKPGEKDGICGDLTVTPKGRKAKVNYRSPLTFQQIAQTCFGLYEVEVEIAEKTMGAIDKMKATGNGIDLGHTKKQEEFMSSLDPAYLKGLVSRRK